jgi:hypothetical protein
MELQVGCSNLRAQRVGAVATPLFPTLGVPLLLSLPVITGRPRAASPHHVAGRSGNAIAETGRSWLLRGVFLLNASSMRLFATLISRQPTVFFSWLRLRRGSPLQLYPPPARTYISERSHFVPLAFELRTRRSVGPPRSVCSRLYRRGGEAGLDVEAFHWSAMNFNCHWRQRVAVALGRGQALISSRAAISSIDRSLQLQIKIPS